MADPYIQNGMIITPVYQVHTKSTWAGDWTLVTNVRPLQSLWSAHGGGSSSSISNATFLFEVGDIARYGNAFAYEAPQDILDDYARISAVHPDNSVERLWYGQVVSDEISQTSVGQIEGPQTITAYGLEYLLERRTIRVMAARAKNLEFPIGYCPDFNRRSKKGGLQLSGIDSSTQLIGNRASAAPAGVYAFSFEDDDVWTAWQAWQSAMSTNKPDGITWTTPQADRQYLEAIIEVWDNVDGTTLKSFLDRICSKRRGLGWYVNVDEEDENDPKAQIRVFTFTDEEITYGQRTVPANPDTTTFTIPTSYPGVHVLRGVPVVYANSDRVEKVRVRSSDRMRVTASFSKDDTSLDKGWTQELQDVYNGANETAISRGAERFKDVYTKFIVPRNWDGTVRDGEAGVLRRSVGRLPDDDGGVRILLAGDRDPSVWIGDKTFHQNLPLLRGYRYDLARQGQQIQVDGAAPPSEVTYYPLMAFAKDSFRIRATDKWMQIDRAQEFNANNANMVPLSAAHISPLPQELGVRVQWRPNHYCAGADEVLNPFPPSVDLDYREMIVTASFDLDDYLHVIREQTNHETNRELSIVVPNTGYWFVMHDTVIGVDENGDLIRIHTTNRILRNDADRLRMIADLAIAWYQRSRQALSFSINYVSASPSTSVVLGTLISDILSGTRSLARTDVNAVVTSQHINYEEGFTTTGTDFVKVEDLVK
jgi:hypothetical protein